MHGNTGAGKTELLKRLAAAGAQVLDLEGLASHRGSVFGSIGQCPQPGQKDFEASIWRELRRIQKSKPVFLEAEGRKIGKLTVPELLLEKIRKGRSVYIEVPVEIRSRRLLETYLDLDNEIELINESLDLLARLKERLGKESVEKISVLVKKGNLLEALIFLLTSYYDPFYAREAKGMSFALTIAGADLSSAAECLISFSEVQKEAPPG